ncbi:hypothetical protein M378DRAFT_1012858 [Amanita muscaria Koide BX008]|uniref:Uncharacterized protein n=1 Tax=Amanita muscaria (strain Koide BX008) TaxID=946122 RepID=A0A0C2SYS0_AMAMK|nr:hypothetical protein M378DRAFT_1012858 [Amanita muscaria Koide BX008]
MQHCIYYHHVQTFKFGFERTDRPFGDMYNIKKFTVRRVIVALPESKFHSHDGAQTIIHVHDFAKHRTNYDYLEKRVVLLREMG